MAKSDHKSGGICCSFCGKPQNKARKLISGPGGIYICDECVYLCEEIIDEETEDLEPEIEDINLLKPREIKAYLDDYVIGQDEAKIALSVAV
ncbi:MAG: ATP-dependent Clp protease ATP-binding subunit ClpX, partial [Lachnospiraceae bacterium]|nr:ATP-dependent Clp protease ATP-binding subunit ClpX [Lachnospiraceae bacterium]